MGQLFSTLSQNSSFEGEWKSSIDFLSDEEVRALIADVRDEDAIGFRSDPDDVTQRDSIVYPISDDAIFKPMREAEAFMMTYVASHTSIPIPRIRRILRPYCTDSEPFDPWYLPPVSVVMDRVDGEPLFTAWPRLSWWRRLRVIWSLRCYVRQLQSLPAPYPDKPGPFDAHDRRHVCKNIFFTLMGGGPFETHEEMVDWFNRRRFDAFVQYHRRTGSMLRCAKLDSAQPLVVSHGDLCMQNIIIDQKGVPWVIAFGEAGVYPAWYDYAKAEMRNMPHIIWPPPPPWWYRWATPFIFGNYRHYYYNFIFPLALADIFYDDPIDWPSDWFARQGISEDID